VLYVCDEDVHVAGGEPAGRREIPGLGRGEHAGPGDPPGPAEPLDPAPPLGEQVADPVGVAAVRQPEDRGPAAAERGDRRPVLAARPAPPVDDDGEGRHVGRVETLDPVGDGLVEAAHGPGYQRFRHGPSLARGPVPGTAAAPCRAYRVIVYSSGLALRQVAQNSNVCPGHRGRLTPWSSRYQLVQPPSFHTARRSRRCSRSLKRRAASGFGSIASPPVSCSSRRQLRTCWICTSIMKTTELWPSPVFGPSSMKKFGSPGTVVPRCASMPSAQISWSLTPPRPVTRSSERASVTLKPVP